MDRFDRLIRAAGYPDEAVRSRAARELGDAGDPRALEPLWALLSDPSAEVQLCAVQALVKLGRDVLDLACERIQSPIAQDREHAGRVLAAFGSVAVPRLLPLLDFEVSTQPALLWITEVLGEIGDVAAVEPFETLLGDWMAGPVVHRRIIMALGQLGAPAAEVLARALSHPDRGTRVQAVFALRDVADARFAEVLCTCLGSEDEVHSEAAGQAPAGSGSVSYVSGDVARDALIRLGPDAIGPLRTVLLSETLPFQARHRALQALDRIRLPECAAPLCEAFDASETAIALFATASVQALGPAALPALISSLEQCGEEAMPLAARLSLIEAALRALASAGLSKALDRASLTDRLCGTEARPGALIRILRHPNPEIREASVQIAGHLENPGATRLLCQALQDRHPPVRKAASERLSLIGDETAELPACRALEDPEEAVRIHAARTLGRLRLPGAVEALQPTREENPKVRLEIVRALVAIGTPEVVVPLCAALVEAVQSTPRRWERAADQGVTEAAKAYFVRPTPEVVLHLCELLADPSLRTGVLLALHCARPVLEEILSPLDEADTSRATACLIGVLQSDKTLVSNDYELGALLLGLLGDRESEEVLIWIARYQERAHAPSAAAIRALGRIGGFRGLRELCDVVFTPTLRDCLEDTLIETEHLGAIPALKECLKWHMSESPRAQAISKALRHIRETKGHLAAHPVVPSAPQRTRNLPWISRKPD
ncbi:MAG: heat repeat-containing lyase [Armatimonadetes bacterium]|nr:heat repeat-containing lyase [Armatimonadota bacterium]